MLYAALGPYPLPFAPPWKPKWADGPCHPATCHAMCDVRYYLNLKSHRNKQKLREYQTSPHQPSTPETRDKPEASTTLPVSHEAPPRGSPLKVEGVGGGGGWEMGGGRAEVGGGCELPCGRLAWEVGGGRLLLA